METNDSIRFNQIRNYKRCFADAIKVITHLPFNLIRSLCLLWGLSSIGIFGLLFLSIFAKSNWGVGGGMVLLLFVLWLQAIALSRLSCCIHELQEGKNELTKCSKIPLREVACQAFNYFILRVVQLLVVGVVVFILMICHVTTVYALIVCAVILLIITYFDLYFLSDTFLSKRKFLSSFLSTFRKCLKNISISFIIYVSVAFFVGVSVVVLYAPTFVLSCGLGAQNFAQQIGDTSSLIPLWVHAFNFVLMACVFVIVNFILTFCRFASVLFWNTILLRQEEKRAQLQQ